MYSTNTVSQDKGFRNKSVASNKTAIQFSNIIIFRKCTLIIYYIIVTVEPFQYFNLFDID